MAERPIIDQALLSQVYLEKGFIPISATDGVVVAVHPDRRVVYKTPVYKELSISLCPSPHPGQVKIYPNTHGAFPDSEFEEMMKVIRRGNLQVTTHRDKPNAPSAVAPDEDMMAAAQISRTFVRVSQGKDAKIRVAYNDLPIVLARMLGFLAEKGGISENGDRTVIPGNLVRQVLAHQDVHPTVLKASFADTGFITEVMEAGASMGSTNHIVGLLRDVHGIITRNMAGGVKIVSSLTDIPDISGEIEGARFNKGDMPNPTLIDARSEGPPCMAYGENDTVIVPPRKLAAALPQVLVALEIPQELINTVRTYGDRVAANLTGSIRAIGRGA